MTSHFFLVKETFLTSSKFQKLKIHLMEANKNEAAKKAKVKLKKGYAGNIIIEISGVPWTRIKLLLSHLQLCGNGQIIYLSKIQFPHL